MARSRGVLQFSSLSSTIPGNGLPVPSCSRPGASQPHNIPVFHLSLQPLQSLLLAHRPLSNLYALGAPWGAILDPFSSLLLRLVSTVKMARVQTLEPDAWVQSLAPRASYFTFSVLGFHLETPDNNTTHLSNACGFLMLGESRSKVWAGLIHCPPAHRSRTHSLTSCTAGLPAFQGSLPLLPVHIPHLPRR